MTDHAVTKLFLALTATVGFVLASLPAETLPGHEFVSTDSLEAWARFGVAGGCLVIVLVGLFFTAPRLTREHRQTVEGICSAHERNIGRICESHAASMREMRAEQREDNHGLTDGLAKMSSSVDAMRTAIQDEGKAQRQLQQMQLEQLVTIRNLKGDHV